MEPLFVYGTLCFEPVWRRITGRPLPRRTRARLPGFRRRQVRGAAYPAVLPDAREQVDGFCYRGLDAALLARLDAFEGPDYQRQRHPVVLADGGRILAQVYVLRADRAQLLGERPWRAERQLPEVLRRYG